MLTVQSIGSAHAQRELFAEFVPTTHTWIVSDLKSKLDLQKRLLERRDFLEGESVLRASELWRTMLSRLRPDLQVVSREFMLTWLGHKLSLLDADWTKTPGVAKTAYDYLTQLMPILSHPEGAGMMEDWFESHEAARSRWGRWFELAHTLWRELLEEGFIAPNWAAGVLVNELDLSSAWSRPLVVDLGAELDQVEADLFVLLSDKLDVTILKPEPEWGGEYARALSAYEVFDRLLKTEKKPSPPALNEPAPRTVRYRKYTTMLAEVKEATAQVRKWLDSGAVQKASDIAIVAPDIEAYWPVLSSYLDQEGIPVQKPRVRRTHAFADVARWLAILRLRTGGYAESDVELALFDSRNGPLNMISYDRFKVLYSALYGREDLARSEEVARLFELQLEPHAFASRDEFVAWSLKQLPDSGWKNSADAREFKRVEDVYKRLFDECPGSLSMTTARWLDYLQRLMMKIEVLVEEGNPDGISCINLSAATNSPATHMIVMGLTEAALRPSIQTGILTSEAMSIAASYGFHLATDDQFGTEFEARWLLSDTSRELFLTVAETDFAGAAQAPSWLWVQGARAQGVHKEVFVPEETRWDEIQKSDFDNIVKERGWRAAHGLIMKEALAEDLGEKPLSPFAAGGVTQLSPSRIEDYLECPFIFACKYHFGLSDVSELDLDVDGARRGSLMHKIFELLTLEPVRFDYSKAEMDDIVERAREASVLELADTRLWPPLKERYVDMGFRFLAFEREIRTRFPETKTIGREVDIAGYLDVETGELFRERPDRPSVLGFIGRIDRIDSDHRGNLAIYDYKSSNSSVSQHGSWVSNNRIQLLLYAMAVQEGLTSLEPAPVIAALYYVARPFNRDSGYRIEDVEQGLVDIEKRKRNRITVAERDRLFGEGRKLMSEAAKRILAGDFEPRPRDPRKCPECQWRSLCRAPHLNT